MKINSIIIEKYLSIITESRAALLENPAEDLSAYDDAIDKMLVAARAEENDDLLRISIDALIAFPKGVLHEFAGSVYRWPNKEFLALLTHAYQRLWPDMPLSEPEVGEVPTVEFVAMTSEEWAMRSGRG